MKLTEKEAVLVKKVFGMFEVRMSIYDSWQDYFDSFVDSITDVVKYCPTCGRLYMKHNGENWCIKCDWEAT